MSRRRLVTTTTALAALLGLAGGPVPAGAAMRPSGAAPPATARLAGETRYETAAAIAGEVPWPTAGDIRWDGPDRIVVVRGDRPLDAVARGARSPVVLPVPPRGPIPAALRARVASRMPSDGMATVAGDARALPDARVRALLGGKDFVRDPGSVLTASADSGMVSWASDDEGVLVGPTHAVSPRVVAEAAVAAHLRPTPLVVLPDSGPVDARPGSHALPFIWQGPFTRVGSVRADRVAAFAAASSTPFLGLRPPARVDARASLSGPDRYATSALVARRASPRGAATVYLADGRGIDAAFGVGLPGPILLVPPGATLPPSTRAALAALRPKRIVALGDAGAVSEAMLAAAAAAVAP